MGSHRQQKATLHDVAAKVGVSPRTVSRVVNDEGGFSEQTRDRVMAAIAELGYRPNLLARSLVTNRSNTLALVVPVIDDPFFPELANGVQSAARSRGMTMYLAVTEGQPDLEKELLSRMMSQAIDGAILFPTRSGDGALDYASQGLPIVTIDTWFDHPNICCVRSDLENGVHRAVDHLRSTGRTTLAMLTNGALAPERRRRERTFREAEGGDQAIVCESEATYDGGYRSMEQILAHHPEVDGVFVYNDVMAIGAMSAARAAGRSVPGDLAVVGCDDIEMSALVSPGLTTVRLDRERLGSEAVTRLIELRETGISPDPVTVPVSLVVRESA